MKKAYIILPILLGSLVLITDSFAGIFSRKTLAKNLAVHADTQGVVGQEELSNTSADMDIDSEQPQESAQAPVAMGDINLDDDQDEQETEQEPEPLQVTVSAPKTSTRYEQSAPVSTTSKVPAEREFDPEQKKKNVEQFLAEAVDFLKKNNVDSALAEFNHGKKFKRGELYIFVYDVKGTCLAHGEDNDLLWDDMYNQKDVYGVLFIQEMIAKARSGGGWTTYQWRGATKISLVKEVQKDGKTFVVGTGYYPHSKVDAVVNLVKGAVALFDKGVKEGRSVDEAFSTLSYPLGRFVFGDLYLYALDFNGIQIAHGELPGIIGTNAWMYRDAQGKLVNQEIIAKLKTTPKDEGVWIDYISKNAPKRTYVEKVVDGKGKNYFIACGYYPDADNKQAVNLVERGYRYMKSNGKSEAVRKFTDKSEMEFRYGDLYLFVYDTKGVCIAHGGNSALVGTNMYNEKDEDGDYYIRQFINKALSESTYGWVDYREKNAFKSAYVERIDIGETYIIGCSVQPITKRETMLMLAKSGADYFKSANLELVLREFVKLDGRFIRGDLSVFVLDAQGICLAAGDDYSLIWKNLMQAQDDSGKSYTKLLINTIKQNRGSATITYRLNGATRIEYAEPVTKNGKTYYVGSNFYF